MNEMETEKLDLQGRIEACRKDYEAVTGKPCQHFFCPILHVDEQTEMCRGHIVTLGTKSIWVPQRKDVDNFYGAVAEAECATAVTHRGVDPVKALLDPTLRKKIRPKIEVAGEECEYYFPKDVNPPPDHSILQIVDDDGNKICNIGLKIHPDKLGDIDGQRIFSIVDRDFVPSVTASVLKGAHLTMFRMLGYQYIFSPAGDWLAHILRGFYYKHNGSHSVTEEEVARFFNGYSSMVLPTGVVDERHLQGTAKDNMLISCFAATEGLYALGVIVRVGSDRFSVFLPTDHAKSINVYFSFLKEPPPSIAARFTRFRPASGDQGAVWEADTTEIRIQRNQDLAELTSHGSIV